VVEPVDQPGLAGLGDVGGTAPADRPTDNSRPCASVMTGDVTSAFIALHRDVPEMN
jgi:hypothetical protein